jgi:signal transduction histidine kinase
MLSALTLLMDVSYGWGFRLSPETVRYAWLARYRAIANSSFAQTSLTPEQRELGSIIEESSSVLLQVINDILDYSKLSSGIFSISSDTAVSIPNLSEYPQNSSFKSC